MEVPCVRVAREEGEETRQALADSSLLNRDYTVDVEDGFVFIPVTDQTMVPGRFDVVDHDVDSRETQTMPGDILGFEPTYERLGDIVIIDEDVPDRAQEIARAILASDLPVKTVANRASKVKGEQRIRDWEVLGGNGLETVHREYGNEFALDLECVYFSPRLATERHRIVEQVESGEHVFDMFAGVGPFAIPIADQGAQVVAVDINPDAIEFLRENAQRNRVTDRINPLEGDVRDVVTEYECWADRIVMNLPHSAVQFLDDAIQLVSEECMLHYYDIQHEEDPFGPGIQAITQAAEPAGFDVDVETQHIVRSYAPHEVNICLDVRLHKA